MLLRRLSLPLGLWAALGGAARADEPAGVSGQWRTDQGQHVIIAEVGDEVLVLRASARGLRDLSTGRWEEGRRGAAFSAPTPAGKAQFSWQGAAPDQLQVGGATWTRVGAVKRGAADLTGSWKAATGALYHLVETDRGEITVVQQQGGGVRAVLRSSRLPQGFSYTQTHGSREVAYQVVRDPAEPNKLRVVTGSTAANLWTRVPPAPPPTPPPAAPAP